MIAIQPVTVLRPAEIARLGHAFFAAQGAGGDWLCEASIDDLVATILERREWLREAVVAAPDSSFLPQPRDQDGKVVWSAGQCADHIVNAQYGVMEAAIIALITPDGRTMFEQPLPFDQVADPPMVDREDALIRLDRATADYEWLLDGIPRNADLTASIDDHRYFGAINLKATLLIAAWHEQAHTTQIQQLRA